MKSFTISFVLVSLLAFVSCSPVSTKGKLSTDICAYERMINDAACHCFIASQSKLIPATMHQMCTDGFGQGLHLLGASCKPYMTKDGAFNSKHYSRMLDLSVKTCFNNGDSDMMKVPHPSARQFTPTLPTFSTSGSGGYGGGFGGGFGGSSYSNNLNIPSITSPVNVGGIDVIWKPTYDTGSKKFGFDIKGSRGGTSLSYSYPSQTYVGSAPIPGKIPGSFSITYKPKEKFVGAGISIPLN